MFQVAPYETVVALQQQLAAALHRIERLEAAQPDWLREEEAVRLTGLSQSTLIRERKKENTLLVVTDSGPLRYLRSSVEAFNEARMLRRAPARHPA